MKAADSTECGGMEEMKARGVNKRSNSGVEKA
jgi:hypothetical protein